MRLVLSLFLILPLTASAQLITRVQLIPLSNYVGSVSASLTVASNYLYSQISESSGVTAAQVTNISQVISTITSNGVVLFTLTASNNLVTVFQARDITTSNGAVSFTMTASNNLASLLSVNDTLTSNALRTAYLASDITTSNGAVAFTMTASNVLRTDISNLQGATNGLLARVNNLDGATNGLTTRANNLEGATNGLNGRVTAQTNTFRTDISNLQGGTNGLGSSITVVSNAFRTDVSNLQGSTNGLRTDVLNLQGGTNGLRTDVVNLQAATNNIDDDFVNFDDADGLWTAIKIGPALEELNDSINVGVPNGTGAKVHWSQLLGVPAGFSDGTDDGGGGGGWSGYDAPATNATFWSSDTNRTNVIIAQRIGQAVPMFSVRGSNNIPILEIDNLGFFSITNGLTNYSLGNTRAAPNNTLVMGIQRHGGMDFPVWTDDGRRSYTPQPALFDTDVYYIAPGSATAVFSHGGTTVNTGGTTISHEDADELKPYRVKVASAATSNSVGGISHNVNLWNAGAHNGSSRVGGAFFFTRWMITNNIAGIVGGGAPRWFVGVANAASPNLTNIVNTTNATGQYLGLMGDIKQSLNMFLTCRDASAEFRTNTGINFVATNSYEFSMSQPHTNRFVRWTLRDLTARLEASGTFSNNVPTNFMKMTILCKNGTNRANEIYFSKLYLNPTQNPRWN